MRLCAAAVGPEQSERYQLEWGNELYEIRAEGTRWHQRAGYVLSVMGSVPALALQWRFRAQRVTE